MLAKKTIIYGLVAFGLIALNILTGCGGNDMRPKDVMNSLAKLTEKKNFDDLSLTVYYIDPHILTTFPLSVEGLISFSSVKKIVINGNEVGEHIDLFKKIRKNEIIPVKKTSRIDARFYYIFESVKDGKLLDVAMWGDDNSVFVNGLEIEGTDSFIDVVFPFLSEDAKNDLDKYLGKGE